MITPFRAGLIIAGIAGVLAFSQGAALADTMTYKLTLSGANEVPPTTSKGTGTADVTYDTVTKVLSWTVTYTGLSGPATASHFHSPGAVGVNAAVTVPLSGDLTSPIKGQATLTDALAKDLLSGMMYYNIHTAANPGGEIRGQVK